MSPYVVLHEPALEVDDPSGVILEPDAKVLCEVCFAAKDARLAEIQHGSPSRVFGDVASSTPDRSMRVF